VEIIRRERQIIRSIAVVVKELCQGLPEDLGIDSTEDTENTSPRQQIKQGEGASNLKFPYREEECTASMLDFEGRFA
jgi:hypothetical protein